MGCFSTIASRLLALLSLLSVCACAWPFPVELANTSFEQPDRNKPDVPLGYSTYASPGTTAKFLWDRETAHSGKVSLSIINDGPATGLWAPANVPCVPGIRYRVRVWVKTENARGRSGVSVRFRDDKGWLGAPVLQPDAVSGTNDWTQLEYEVLTPGAATNFTLFLSNTEGKGGQLWFDDLSVEDNLDEVLRTELPAIREKLTAAESSVGKSAMLARLNTAELHQWRDRTTSLLERVEALGKASGVTMDVRRELAAEWTSIRRFYQGIARLLGLSASLREWGRVSGSDHPSYLVGWQEAETRVWLREQPIALRISQTENLRAVKGEVAATQIVVAAIDKPLEEVRVTVGTLRGSGGSFPPDSATVHPVGFVHLTRPAGLSEGYPQEASHVGWWPEILLENFPFEVASGDSQPVWLSVRVPRSVKAGIYSAPVTIASRNAPVVKLALQVEVADYELPRAWSFRKCLLT